MNFQLASTSVGGRPPPYEQSSPNNFHPHGNCVSCVVLVRRAKHAWQCPDEQLGDNGSVVSDCFAFFSFVIASIISGCPKIEIELVSFT